MLREITSEQLVEWRHYSDLEPFDEEREDLRTASIVGTLINIQRAKYKQPPIKDLYEVALLFGDSKRPEVKRSWQQLKALGRMCAEVIGFGKRG